MDFGRTEEFLSRISKGDKFRAQVVLREALGVRQIVVVEGIILLVSQNL